MANQHSTSTDMNHTFIHLLFFTILSLLLSSCSKEDNSIDNPIEESKVVEDICTKMDDINFINFCYTNFDIDKDGKVSMIEADAVSEIRITAKEISSLTGIEYFTNITVLECYLNELTSLNVSGCVNLTMLYCHHNELTSLDVSSCAELSKLDCSNNPLTILYLNAKSTWSYISYPEGVNMESKAI